MAAPTPPDESRRPIDHTHPREPQDTRTARQRLDETALGGADAVPDTPDVAAHGAHVGEERRRTPRGERSTFAQAGTGKGTSNWLMIAGVVVVLVLLAVMFF
jgi:hypothetical protein